MKTFSLSNNIRIYQAWKKDIDFLVFVRKNTIYKHSLNAGITLNEWQHQSIVLETLKSTYIIQKSGINIWVLSFEIIEKYLDYQQLQILPEYQNRWIGKFITAYMISLAQKYDKKIHLKVLKNNPAKDLYLRFKFQIVWENTYFYFMERS